MLYSFPASVTSMAVHPLSPFYAAFALGDGSVRLVDRRMTQDFIGKIDVSDLSERSTLRQYKPYVVGTQPCKITSVQFNSVGSELLVSYSEDYVYLFNSRLFHVGSRSDDRGMTADSSAFISKPVYLSQLERYSPGQRRRQNSSVKRKSPANYGRSPPTSSKPALKGESVPPAKKLRLRGDWSDTGPEARPENDSEGGESRDQGILMNRMSRMLAQWIDMSLSPDSTNESGDREEVPGRYRHMRRRMAPPTSATDGASPTTTSSATSSNNSFQLFDSDNEEEKEERRSEDKGERCEPTEHPLTLDSKEDTSLLALDSPNGTACATKSEGVATVDLSTLSERLHGTTEAARDSSDHKASLIQSQHVSALESYTTVESDNHIPDVEANLTLSDDRSTDSTEIVGSSRTLSEAATNEVSQGRDCELSSRDPVNSTASNTALTIENRTKNSSPNCAPAVVVEGETDSDDCDVDGSCDESHDNQKGSHSEELVFDRYFMRYKGHRNSRTMVCLGNFLYTYNFVY